METRLNEIAERIRGLREMCDFSIAQMASYVWLGQAVFAMRFVDISNPAASGVAASSIVPTPSI